MPKARRLKERLLPYKYALSDLLFRAKARLWNKHILLWWYRLWIRKNEFHHSLNLDPQAMLVMNKDERRVYMKDLMRRRHIAHERDLARH